MQNIINEPNLDLYMKSLVCDLDLNLKVTLRGEDVNTYIYSHAKHKWKKSDLYMKSSLLPGLWPWPQSPRVWMVLFNTFKRPISTLTP